MMGKVTVVLLTSFMSSTHLACELRSFALYQGTRSQVSLLSQPFPPSTPLSFNTNSYANTCRTKQHVLTNPIILTPLASNSPFNLANAPNSVVHTGVKSAGCENNTAHFPSSHVWKSISPCVVCALKLGASVPRRMRGCESLVR